MEDVDDDTDLVKAYEDYNRKGFEESNKIELERLLKSGAVTSPREATAEDLDKIELERIRKAGAVTSPRDATAEDLKTEAKPGGEDKVIRKTSRLLVTIDVPVTECLLLLSVCVYGDQGLPPERDRCDGKLVGANARETSGKTHYGAPRMENQR